MSTSKLKTLPQATMAIVAGTIGVSLAQAYHRIRERAWLREEMALLPFPPKR